MAAQRGLDCSATPVPAGTVSPATFAARWLGMPKSRSNVRIVNPAELVHPPIAALSPTYPPGYRFSMSDDALTLAGVPAGRRVVLGDPKLDPAHTRRLAELGLRAGAEVLLLHRTAGRGRVVAVGDTRIALDRATLQQLPVASGAPEASGS